MTDLLSLTFDPPRAVQLFQEHKDKIVEVGSSLDNFRRRDFDGAVEACIITMLFPRKPFHPFFRPTTSETSQMHLKLTIHNSHLPIMGWYADERLNDNLKYTPCS